MYALVDIKGKQYKVEKGSIIKIDRLKNDSGDKIEFDSVLMVSGEKEIRVGQPYLKGIKIKATVEDHVSDKKLIVYKYKKRKGYRKKQGHRQKFTLLKVQDIAGIKVEATSVAGKSATETEAKAAAQEKPKESIKTQETKAAAKKPLESSKPAAAKAKPKTSAQKPTKAAAKKPLKSRKPAAAKKPLEAKKKRPAAKAKPKATPDREKKASASKNKAKARKKA